MRQYTKIFNNEIQVNTTEGGRMGTLMHYWGAGFVNYY